MAEHHLGTARADEAVDAALVAALRSRHADTLRGALAPLEAVVAAEVELSVSREDAMTLAGQHLALHAVNLLARLEGVVATITVTLDPAADASNDVPLLPGVDPRLPNGAPNFTAALEAVAALPAPHRVRRPDAGAGGAGHARPAGEVVRRVRLRIGRPDDRPATAVAAVHAAADDWVAYVGRLPGPACDPSATLPFGAHAAAALAVAEVFRLLRASGPLSAGPDRMTWSVWSCTQLVPEASDGPSGVTLARDLPNGLPPFTLVGVGAVGSAFLLTLWASGVAVRESDAVDGDAVSRTNLNRYPLFGVSDVGQPKASGAATLLRRDGRGDRAPFALRGVDAWWADYRRRSPAPIPLLISAVDTNAARHQLQDSLPRVILGASTHELRAEVDRYAPADPASRCLKCHNPVAVGETDAVLRARLLTLTPGELQQEAEDRGVEADVLQRYVDDLRAGGTGCAILAGPALEKLRRMPGEGAFAVSFVSALAGTMLAAQLFREASSAGPLLRGEQARAHLQLWRPAAAVNGLRATTPDPSCWCAQPAVRSAHAAIWPDGRSSSTD